MSKKNIEVWLVEDGDWDDTARYLVSRATSEQDAIDQVAAFRKEQYNDTLWGPTSARLIDLDEGVIKL